MQEILKVSRKLIQKTLSCLGSRHMEKKEKIFAFTEIMLVVIWILWAADLDWTKKSILDYLIIALIPVNIILWIIKAVLIIKRNRLIEERDKSLKSMG